MKIKRKYFILQKRNRQFLKSITKNKIKMSFTQRRRLTKADENFLAKILKSKRQRLTIDLKSINLDVYNNKNFKKFKN